MENFQGGRVSYVESQFSIVLYPTYDTIFVLQFTTPKVCRAEKQVLSIEIKCRYATCAGV